MKEHRIFYKKIILFFTFIIQFSIYAYTQNPLRQVEYETKTTTLFSVPLNTDMSLITNMDLSMMSVGDILEEVKKTVDIDNNITIIHKYPQQPLYSHHYQRMISKSESGINGIKLFDRENNIIFSEDISDIDAYQIEDEEMEHYGLYPNLDFDLSKLTESFNNEGFEVLINDNLLSAISPNMEIYINKRTMVYEIRVFEDELMLRSSWIKYKSLGEYCIPIRAINYSYENLQNGIRCQKAKVTDYLNYSVINSEGDYIVHYFNESNARIGNSGSIKIYDYDEKVKKNYKLEVYPNPVAEVVNVEIPYFLDEHIELKIVNTVGRIVYSKKGIKTGSNIEINIDYLPSGIYVVMVGKDTEWKNAKLVKLEK